MKMAEELHVQVMEPVVMTDSAHKRFKLAPALAFMEQNLFRPRPAKYTKPVEEIHLAAVKNPQEELILVARQINALIRQGYRYREIAVVTGAVEAYQSYMDPVFTKYEIPYFMDTTKEVLFHPFIECIRAALEIVDTNFSYEAVMRFLRCGFCDIAEDDLDRLDSYLVATGIRGKAAWSRRWGHMPRQKTLYDLEQLEKLREKIYGYLEPFAAVFARKDARVSDGIRALYQLLTQLDTQHQLWNREQQLLAQGEETRSREYAQIYTIVMQLLEKYNLLLGEEPLQIRDFTEVLEAGLSAADVAVIYRKTAGGEYKKLAESSKPSYTDKNVSSGKTYTYKIVAKNEQKKADEAAKVTFSNTEAVQIRSQKYTYSQMKKDMQELAQQYSDYCEMTKIGTSVQGRGIYDKRPRRGELPNGKRGEFRRRFPKGYRRRGEKSPRRSFGNA